MRRWLARLLRYLIRFVVGFFPLLALLVVLAVEPIAGRALLIVGALGLLLALVLFWLARRDRELRLAVGVGCFFLAAAATGGTLAAALLAGVTWHDGGPSAREGGETAPPPTEPSRAYRYLWHEAAPEWLRHDPAWPLPVLGPAETGSRAYLLPTGGYAMHLGERQRGLLVIAPWGTPPYPNVLLVAQVRWRGFTRRGLFGLICRYQNEQQFYAFVLSGDGYGAIWKHTQNGAWALAPWQRVLPVPRATPGLSRLPATPQGTATTQVPTPPQPSPTPSATPTPGLPLQQGEQRLSAACQGSTLRLYIAGRLVLEAHDSAYKRGRVGLWGVAPAIPPWTLVWLDLDAYVYP